MRDSGRLEDRSPAKPEMQDEGQPEGCIRGAAGGLRNRGNLENQESESADGCEIRGNSKIHQPAQPKDEEAGQPEESSLGAAKGCGVRGNPETQNQPSRKMQGDEATRNLHQEAERDDA
jgi:hypothetical protein